ncbi:MAG: Ada metal-binding domain-containing protein [Chloroflexota bacterium]
MLEADPTYNGQYITAVKTTGIYCLPGCRARKPKPEHVEFFATPEEARAAGYRPCKICRPDDYYLGLHTKEAQLESLVAQLRENPTRYHDVKALADAIGIGQTKLFTLFRTYYHTTPASMLVRLRITAAQRALLETDTTVTAIASDCGFESLSAFHENFRKYTMMSPTDYRRIRETSTFLLDVPEYYHVQRMLGYLGRDQNSLTDRVEGKTWLSAIRLNDTSGAIVQVTFSANHVQCDILDAPQLAASVIHQIHWHVLSGLGLHHDPLRFETQVSSTPDLAPLIQGQQGVRIPLIANHFDGLTWVILGQRITLTFAYTLRRRLIERVGHEIANGVWLPPLPEAIAALTEPDLIGLGFPRPKAQYLLNTAQVVADGQLPLARLKDKSATHIERVLLAMHGIGPWSAQYLLMRSYGFLDCVPVGDAGLRLGLQRFFKLDQRPDRLTTLRLMEPFQPYRSLATFHFWQYLGKKE